MSYSNTVDENSVTSVSGTEDSNSNFSESEESQNEGFLEEQLSLSTELEEPRTDISEDGVVKSEDEFSSDFLEEIEDFINTDELASTDSENSESLETSSTLETSTTENSEEVDRGSNSSEVDQRDLSTSSCTSDPIFSTDEENFPVETIVQSTRKMKESVELKKYIIFATIIIIVVLLLFLLVISSIIFFTSGSYSKSQPRKSFHYLKCNVENKYEDCNSGNFELLNDDMTHGFVSLDDKKQEFLLVYADEKEYKELYKDLTSYLQAETSSKYYRRKKKKKVSSYKNIEYIGTGYDIYSGNPIFPSGLDYGFRSNIFKVTKAQKKTIDLKDSTSCSLDFDVSIINSLDVLMDIAKKTIKYSQSGKLDGRIRPFSLSPATTNTVMKVVTESKSFALSTAVCEVYRMNLVRYDHPFPTETFMNALLSLSDKKWEHLTRNEKLIYFDFLEVYGTHVVTNIHMGAKYSYEFQTYEHMKQKDDEDRLKMRIRMLDILNYSEQKRGDDKNSLNNLIEHHRIRSIGARPVLESRSKYRDKHPKDMLRKTQEKWLGRARFNPLPIYYETVPLTQYYMYLYGNRIPLIQGQNRPDNLETAILENVQRLKDELVDTEHSNEHLKYPSFLETCECMDSSSSSSPKKTENSKAIIYNEQKCLGMIKGEKLEWWVARQKCQLWGGDLVVVDDILKNFFVSENFVSNDIWIGYFHNGFFFDNDDEEEKEEKDEEKGVLSRKKSMRWVSGKKPNFEYFHAGQPDLEDQQQYCVQSNYQFSSSWAGKKCNSRLEYVCERPYYPIDFKEKFFFISSSDDNFHDEVNFDAMSKEEKIEICEDELEGRYFEESSRCYRHFSNRLDWGIAKFECMKWVPYSWDGKLAVVTSRNISLFLTGQVIGEHKDHLGKIIEKFRTELLGDEGSSLRKKQEFMDAVSRRKHVWIGLTDIAQEGMWKWEDGMYLTGFRDWARGSSSFYRGESSYPSFFSSIPNQQKVEGIEVESSYDCVVMNKETGNWVTEVCDVNAHQFVCEFDI